MKENASMKATGIVRKVDELGRVVLPVELRRTLNIAERDPLEIYINGSDIVLRKYNPGCAFCGSMEGLVTCGDNTLCRDCVTVFAETLE
jgi:transcriptional pleiotropic regulator of transition state genes